MTSPFLGYPSPYMHPDQIEWFKNEYRRKNGDLDSDWNSIAKEEKPHPSVPDPTSTSTSSKFLANLSSMVTDIGGYFKPPEPTFLPLPPMPTRAEIREAVKARKRALMEEDGDHLDPDRRKGRRPGRGHWEAPVRLRSDGTLKTHGPLYVHPGDAIPSTWKNGPHRIAPIVRDASYDDDSDDDVSESDVGGDRDESESEEPTNNGDRAWQIAAKVGKALGQPMSHWGAGVPMWNDPVKESLILPPRRARPQYSPLPPGTWDIGRITGTGIHAMYTPPGCHGDYGGPIVQIPLRNAELMSREEIQTLHMLHVEHEIVKDDPAGPLLMTAKYPYGPFKVPFRPLASEYALPALERHEIGYVEAGHVKVIAPCNVDIKQSPAGRLTEEIVQRIYFEYSFHVMEDPLPCVPILPRHVDMGPLDNTRLTQNEIQAYKTALLRKKLYDLGRVCKAWWNAASKGWDDVVIVGQRDADRAAANIRSWVPYKPDGHLRLTLQMPLHSAWRVLRTLAGTRPYLRAPYMLERLTILHSFEPERFAPGTGLDLGTWNDTMDLFDVKELVVEPYAGDQIIDVNSLDVVAIALRRCWPLKIRTTWSVDVDPIVEMAVINAPQTGATEEYIQDAIKSLRAAQGIVDNPQKAKSKSNKPKKILPDGFRCWSLFNQSRAEEAAMNGLPRSRRDERRDDNEPVDDGSHKLWSWYRPPFFREQYGRDYFQGISERRGDTYRPIDVGANRDRERDRSGHTMARPIQNDRRQSRDSYYARDDLATDWDEQAGERERAAKRSRGYAEYRASKGNGDAAHGAEATARTERESAPTPDPGYAPRLAEDTRGPHVKVAEDYVQRNGSDELAKAGKRKSDDAELEDVVRDRPRMPSPSRDKPEGIEKRKRESTEEAEANEPATAIAPLAGREVRTEDPSTTGTAAKSKIFKPKPDYTEQNALYMDLAYLATDWKPKAFRRKAPFAVTNNVPVTVPVAAEDDQPAEDVAPVADVIGYAYAIEQKPPRLPWAYLNHLPEAERQRREIWADLFGTENGVYKRYSEADKMWLSLANRRAKPKAWKIPQGWVPQNPLANQLLHHMLDIWKHCLVKLEIRAAWMDLFRDIRRCAKKGILKEFDYRFLPLSRKACRKSLSKNQQRRKHMSPNPPIGSLKSLDNVLMWDFKFRTEKWARDITRAMAARKGQTYVEEPARRTLFWIVHVPFDMWMQEKDRTHFKGLGKETPFNSDDGDVNRAIVDFLLVEGRAKFDATYKADIEGWSERRYFEELRTFLLARGRMKSRIGLPTPKLDHIEATMPVNHKSGKALYDVTGGQLVKRSWIERVVTRAEEDIEESENVMMISEELSVNDPNRHDRRDRIVGDLMEAWVFGLNVTERSELLTDLRKKYGARALFSHLNWELKHEGYPGVTLKVEKKGE